MNVKPCCPCCHCFYVIEGWRIGKGQGLSDLEYAMMVSTGSVNSDAVVMTLVHDSQVVDLPDHLFGPHDVPVDYIVTPTQVISCADHVSLAGCRPSKPLGIIWSLLGPNDLDRIPVLRRIRYREWKSGKKVCLSGEETEPNDLEDVILPEPHVSVHGDYQKPRPSGNQEKLQKDRLTGGGCEELKGEKNVDEAKNGSTKVTADESKMKRYAARPVFSCPSNCRIGLICFPD